MSFSEDRQLTEETPVSFPPDQLPAAAPVIWERWPLREDPRGWLKVILLLALALVVGAVLVVSLPVTAAVALGLALVVTLSPYLLPRRFEVGAEGLSIRQGFYTTRRGWSEVSDYQKVSGGYLFSLRPKEGAKPPRPNLLAPNSKELFLPFPLEPEKLSTLESLLTRHIPNI